MGAPEGQVPPRRTAPLLGASAKPSADSCGATFGSLMAPAPAGLGLPTDAALNRVAPVVGDRTATANETAPIATTVTILPARYVTGADEAESLIRAGRDALSDLDGAFHVRVNQALVGIRPGFGERDLVGRERRWGPEHEAGVEGAAAVPLPAVDDLRRSRRSRRRRPLWLPRCAGRRERLGIEVHAPIRRFLDRRQEV